MISTSAHKTGQLINAVDYFFEISSKLNKSFLVGSEEVSYPDLNDTVDRMANWFQQEMGTEKKIILISVNNLFFITSYLAIIKSGNICIPLDPSIEKSSFDYIVKITEPSALFITPDIQNKLEVAGQSLFTPDDLQAMRIDNKDGLRTDPLQLEKCAEIIFTSGSTGIPKGVMISHKNLIANTESIVSYLRLTEDDRMLIVLPFYYCYGLSLLHTHLRVGGSIVLNNSFMFLGSVISDLIKYRCTGFAGVPSHFQILLRKSDSFKSTAFPDLKYVTQAGGKLATVFIDEFRNNHPEIRFIVMYGQTEATARLSWLPPEEYEARKGSMGKGIPGVELKVVNDKVEPVKPGETGEVIAFGDNIMLGYYSDPESTSKVIRNGWLYTGDLGTVDADGYIYLTARSKEIIKVRGKRISPKEIEAVILEIPEVIDCTVEGIEDDTEGETLKATVVLRKEIAGIVTRDTISRHCSNHLALYKIPKVYEFIEELKVSASGKKLKQL